MCSIASFYSANDRRFEDLAGHTGNTNTRSYRLSLEGYQYAEPIIGQEKKGKKDLPVWFMWLHAVTWRARSYYQLLHLANVFQDLCHHHQLEFEFDRLLLHF